MARNIKWGIFGAGKISSDFANAIHVVADTDVVGVAASEKARADEFARVHKIAHAYGSYEELAKSDGVDVIYVGTTHNTHFEQSKLALESGKHVVVEKPMTVNLKEAEELVRIAREKKLFLLEGMWTRFFPLTKKVRSLLEGGEIGDVVAVQSRFGFKCPPGVDRIFKKELAGGALLDIGIYSLASVSLAFKGAYPTEIKAVGALADTGVDVNGSISLKYGDRGIGSILFTVLAEPPSEFAYLGTDGYVCVDAPVQCPQKIRWAKSSGREKEEEQVMRSALPKANPDEPPMNFPGSEGMQYEVAAVCDYIRAGATEASEYTLDESLNIMRTMDEIRAQLGVDYPQDK